MIKINERDDRLKKLAELKKIGVNPYPAKADRNHFINKVLSDFEKLQLSGLELKLAGRLRSLRAHGNLTFSQIEDSSGKIQLAFSKKEIGADSYKLFTKYVDIGDFVQITGTAFLTHNGEKSVMVKEWKLLTKTIRPLPEKWHGLSDEEELLRKRYLDILFNDETKQIFIKRAKFWQAVRNFLIKKDFLEVETPVLENTAGGADAKPFATHHNALNLDVYLRICAGELWQKRLMVAGYEKTFEIGRVFRNEGMDAEHLQDYTHMEFYMAYADYQDGMKLVEELFKHVAQETFGTLKFKIKNFEVDLGKKWELYDYRETVKKYTKIDILETDLNS
ncbi:MAG: amino acid--tRNA ligase-related protein, partial [bacterium]